LEKVLEIWMVIFFSVVKVHELEREILPAKFILHLTV
jgi:hypothetical protein